MILIEVFVEVSAAFLKDFIVGNPESNSLATLNSGCVQFNGSFGKKSASVSKSA